MNETTHTATSPVFDCIMEMLLYEAPLENRALIEQARPILWTVESAFEYYLKNASSQKTTMMYLPRIVPDFEGILVDYITIRFGLFTKAFKGQLAFQKTHPYEIPSNNSKEYKEFEKPIIVFDKNGRQKKTTVGDHRMGFTKIALRLLDMDDDANVNIFFDRPVNMLVCRDSLKPAKRTSLLSKYVNEGFSIRQPMNIIAEEDIDEIKNRVRYAFKKNLISSDNPIVGNAFVIYVNSPRYRSYTSSEVLSKLAQMGYRVDNLFVFKVTDKTYSLRTLVEEKAHLGNIYLGQANPEEDFICLPVADAVKNTDGLSYSTDRMVIECGEAYDDYFPEVVSMLDGFDHRQRVLCNIISTCATTACEEAFFRYLQTLDSEFEPDETVAIFEYVRKLWQNTIIPEIENFANGSDRMAMVVEASTPWEIKSEIQFLFPNMRIAFYKPSDLVPVKGRINISEGKIVVMRFLQCKSYPSVYPNSYDPYIVNPEQELMEIIPEILFKEGIRVGERNRIRHVNGVLDCGYRRTVCQWKPGQYLGGGGGVSSHNIFGDEEEYYENNPMSTGADRVCLKYGDGSTSNPIDTEPVVYRLSDGSLHVGTMREIADNATVNGIQLLSELERDLEGLLDERDNKGIEADTAIREDLAEKYPGFDFSSGEIWKLALKAKVEVLGLAQVISDLSPRLEEKNVTLRVRDWSNPESRTMLPRKKRTRRIVFEYIGITGYRSYLNSLYSRYLRGIRDSRLINGLIDDMIRVVVGKEINEAYFDRMARTHQEAFDLFDVGGLDDLVAIKDIIDERIDIKEIESITTYDE